MIGKWICDAYESWGELAAVNNKQYTNTDVIGEVIELKRF